VTPVLSVITSIGLDHTDILGDTLEKVAFEKGGIIKPSVPVVVGAVSEAVKKFLSDIAQERGAEVHFTHPMSDEFENNPSHTCGAGLSLCGQRGSTVFSSHHSSDEDSIIKAFLDEFLPQMDLKGDYQGENLLTVMQAVRVLFPEISDSDLEIVMDSIFHAAKRTGFRGRWEVLSQKPYVVCDIAHNPHGMRPVMEQLCRVYSEALSKSVGEKPKLYVVFGVMADKDLETISGYLPREAYYFYTAADSPRAMAPSKLSEWMDSRNFRGDVVSGVCNAVEKCLSQASDNDVIYIGGSSYVVAEALKLF
jgi:dihydrofolate synthase/folylpolyglutamate synthase